MWSGMSHAGIGSSQKNSSDLPSVLSRLNSNPPDEVADKTFLVLTQQSMCAFAVSRVRLPPRASKAFADQYHFLPDQSRTPLSPALHRQGRSFEHKKPPQ